MSDIPYARQDIVQDDIEAAIQVLRSDFLTQGPTVSIFEGIVSNYCGSKYAVAVNSATSALHISCLALGVQKGDFVWTTPISFVASANCAIYCGAEIDFVDIESSSFNLSTEHLKEKLLKAKNNNTLPKVVIVVHLAGSPCDMQGIYFLAQEYGFKIIEDASHAIGAKYNDENIGNCRYSEITIFSFHPVKIITSCEGGMALTNDTATAKKLNLLRSHGITSLKTMVKDSMFHEDYIEKPKEEMWGYQQIDLGFNYRMSDLHAAIGVSQMKRLDSIVLRRHEIVDRYNKLLFDLPLLPQLQKNISFSAYHLYIVRIKLDQIKKNQKEIYEAFYKAGIYVNLHYIPIYRQPYYEGRGFKKGYCLNAEKYYSEALSLPLYPTLKEAEQDRVIKAAREILI